MRPKIAPKSILWHLDVTFGALAPSSNVLLRLSAILWRLGTMHVRVHMQKSDFFNPFEGPKQ